MELPLESGQVATTSPTLPVIALAVSARSRGGVTKGGEGGGGVGGGGGGSDGGGGGEPPKKAN